MLVSLTGYFPISISMVRIYVKYNYAVRTAKHSLSSNMVSEGKGMKSKLTIQKEKT
jgi:hypothetical protein